MKTELLEVAFGEYLRSSNSPFAILINGSWGSGKTHFWKSKLVPLAEAAGYKTLYISLNGLNKIEALEHQLFVRLIPILGKQENKLIKGAVTLLTNAANVASRTLLKGSLDELFKGVGLDSFDFSKYIICFDDLERSKIDIKEVLGFINNYIEHKSLKAMILSDESRVSNQGEYDSIKEKVIGRIWNFELDVRDTLPALYGNFKKSDNAFYDFLKSKNEVISEVVLDYEFQNLRIVSFYLSILEGLFPILKSAKKEYVSEIILMTALIANEFKMGRLKSGDFADYRHLDNIEQFIFSIKVTESLNKKHDKPSPARTYAEEFHDRYLGNKKRSFIFYPSIYSYVLTGYLDTKLLIDELVQRDPKPVPVKIQEFRSLITFKFRELTNEDFLDLTKKVLENLRNGEFSIYDYSTLAAFYYYFVENGLIAITKIEIDQAIHEGLEISSKRNELNESLLLNLLHFQDNPEVTKIKDEIHRIHGGLKNSQLRKVAENFVEVLNTKDEGALAEQFEKHRMSKELFQFIDCTKLLKILTTTSNKKLSNFSQLLEERYKVSNIGEFLFEDYDALKFLEDELFKYLSNNLIGQPNKFLIENLVRVLSEICKHLLNTKKV